MSISDKIREAREWSHCIDTLKASVDSMYEICRIQQNILGCEEAIMFLKNGIRDFLSLIDTIKIEQNWENSEKRPTTALAWEIRGTIAKNNLALSAKNVKEVECQTKFDENKAEEDSTRRINDKEKREENEWQVVERRKGGARNEQRPQQQGEEGPCFAMGKAKKAPKSAMDLPQTKASMAKMAYSRQLLFEKHKKTLLEKLNAKRRTEKATSEKGDGQTKGKGTTEIKAKPSAQMGQIMVGKEQQEEEEKRGKELLGKGQQQQQMAGCLKTLIDQLSDDCEWRAMTEEEESLAQEEESLQKEIEEEEEGNLPDFVGDFVDNSHLELNVKGSQGTNGKECQNESEGKEGPILGDGAEPNHYRNPGELAQLRAKLLSPTKRRKAEEIDNSSENKLRRAEELRTLLKREKAQRLHLLHRRVEEVRTKREQIQQKKRAHLEMVKERIQKAEENRQKSLEEIVLKAQEDEMKIIEINLLNSFEAANQRLGKRFIQIRERNRYAKVVQKAEEERQKRIEENRQQREEAEKRRKDAEEQRSKRLNDQANQRLERQCYALNHRAKTMEKYRAKVAQHNQKICQRKENELADKQKLMDKIQRKHEKRTENYEQCKEQVRRRAMELSSPRPTHLWAQTLADFSQIPSDLALQQKAFSLDNAVEHAEGDATEEKGAGGGPKSCFRCGTKEAIICNDLQLLAHIMSEAHLTNADRKFDSFLQCGVISYDFVKNELERMTLSQQHNSEEFAEIMTKSTDECCALGNVSMDKIIVQHAEVFISDQNLRKLLTIDQIKRKNNGTKKKREKIRQMIIREFKAMPQIEKSDERSTMASTKNAKMVGTLQAKVDKLEKAAEEGQLEEDELKGVLRKTTELANALRNAHNTNERAMLQQNILRSKIVDKLFSTVNLISQKNPEAMNNNGVGMRVLAKCLELFANLVDCEHTTTHLQQMGPMTALSLCDLFQQIAANVPFVSANPSSSLGAFSSSPLSVALFILYQFGRLITDRPNHDTDCELSLFTFLCSCSLLEFVSLCAKRLDLHELLQRTSWSNDLERFNGESKMSVCEVITFFVASLLENYDGNAVETMRQQILVRKDSAESEETVQRSCSPASAEMAHPQQQSPMHKLRLCAVLWMYCLSVIAYHHFRVGTAHFSAAESAAVSSNPINLSNPSSPSKSECFLSTEMTATLSVCVLRQFNAMAEFCSRHQLEKGPRQSQTMLQLFLSIETGNTMALRMTCIFRSILRFVVKASNEHSQENSTNAQRRLQQQMSALTEQCIRAIGHFAVENIRNQLCCVFGWRRSLLSMLCTSLPLNFVHSEPQKHSLIPTLIAILRHSPIGMDQIRTEFCLQYLIGYLKAAIQSRTSERSSDRSKFDFLTILEPSIEKWVSAKEFFESNITN